MPGFNGTGPMGMGPRTGGGFGYCPPVAGPAAPIGGGFNFGVGRGGYPRGGGRGRAWGGGRGPGWGMYPGMAPRGYFNPYVGSAYQADPSAERAFLEQQAKGLQNELELIRQRLEEIEPDNKPPAG